MSDSQSGRRHHRVWVTGKVRAAQEGWVKWRWWIYCYLISYLLSRFAQMAPRRRSKNIFWWPQAAKSFVIGARILPRGPFESIAIISPPPIINIYIHQNNLASLFNCYNQHQTQTHSGYVGKHIFHRAANSIPFLSQTVNFFLGTQHQISCGGTWNSSPMLLAI